MAFLDFDHTVVDGNTDIVARDLIAADKIPTRVKELYNSSGWIPYMQEIFHLLHDNDLRASHILKAIEAIPAVCGFTELIKQLHDQHNFEFVIISDSNSEFIDCWLRRHNMTGYIQRVFTNAAHFADDGRLMVQPHHHQTECNFSSENLCKGAVMEAYVQERGVDSYDKFFYVGDGHNDLCPILRLGKWDVGCARRGYRLEKELRSLSAGNGNDAQTERKLDPRIVYWDDGRDLLQEILNHI